MYIVPIAWIYVALMMAVAEANNTTGTVLGAIITFVLYGLLPVGLILYFMGSPARRRAIKAREKQESSRQDSVQPDAGSLAPTDTVPPVGKEP